MRSGYVGVLMAVAVVSSAVTAFGQSGPRTADGQPDIQGTWGYAVITPLERPSEFGDKAVLTPQEAAEFEKRNAVVQDRDRRDATGVGERGSDGRSDLDRAYNQFWWDFGTKVVGNFQTSLIVDPPNGKLPAMTAAGQRRAAALNARGFAAVSAREEGPAGRSYDSYEDRPNQERCLTWSVAGPPMIPGAYNNNAEIVQGPGWVAIYNEMIHEHRLIPLDGRPFINPAVSQWLGDSRAHWEGNTLVVETRNFNTKRTFRGASGNMSLVERFTRASADMLLYEFTVTDPDTWTQPWSARIAMERNPLPIYEYACHEGNYSLETVLAGARAMEKTAAEAAKKGSN